MPTALVTGASRGLGLALARALAGRGYRLVVDARGPEALERARAELAEATDVVALAGDVTDERHRRALVGAAGPQLDLLVNNASLLGPSPQPGLTEYPLDVLRRVYEANVLAPLALVQLAVPLLPAGAGRGRREVEVEHSSLLRGRLERRGNRPRGVDDEEVARVEEPGQVACGRVLDRAVGAGDEQPHAVALEPAGLGRLVSRRRLARHGERAHPATPATSWAA